MLTALGLAFLLWQPDPTCIGCGGTAAGGFPLSHGHVHGNHYFSHVWDYCAGDVWGLQATKFASPVGTYVPGGDPWAFQMHGGIPVTAPVNVPATAPAPAAAPGPPPARRRSPPLPRSPAHHPRPAR